MAAVFFVTQGWKAEIIFFECRVTKEIWTAVLIFLRIPCKEYSWHMLIPWLETQKKNSLRSEFTRMACVQITDDIWYQRNKKIFKTEELDTDTITKRIIWNIKMKMTTFTKSHRYT
ncbi:hypothetical protein QQ045_032129 [Rhodiola kirilowii]